MTEEEIENKALTNFKMNFCSTCEDREVCDVSILNCNAYDAIYLDAYKDGYKQGQESMLFEFALEDRGKLLKKIEELKATISTMEITTSELIAQIEKMKCCQNCKYSYVNRDYEPCNLCSNYINWEVAK